VIPTSILILTGDSIGPLVSLLLTALDQAIMATALPRITLDLDGHVASIVVEDVELNSPESVVPPSFEIRLSFSEQ
jgi:hypothetical protein